ncbi:hypothetical protein GCM10009808_13700 [Microbacterium sediminicola]|uniref:FAD-binding FR-type domain-containing protein n=2 Tax=Microbacterium sediminicola TaxID=415210 RepID=A0ABP4U1T9_9MICO
MVRSGWNRVLAVLGRLSMYRLVLFALVGIAVIAFALSFAGLVVPSPLEMIVSLGILIVACGLVDLIAHRIVGHAPHLESTLITALILLFVLRPPALEGDFVTPLAFVGVAVAGAVAAASKYLLVWRSRHIFNPAAVGAAVLTIISIWVPDIGGSSWWVGTPVLAIPVIVFGLAVLWRTEKLRVVALFVVVAVVVAFARTLVQYQSAGLDVDVAAITSSVLWSSPFLFLGAFMLSEPLTLPPRRWQQLIVAAVVGALAGWPIFVGEISLGQERALLIGNLVAFAFALRAAVRLTLVNRALITPTTRLLTFRAKRPINFMAGQYLELDVPHRRSDARGTRREFSIASAPEDLPIVRVAFREFPADQGATPPSSFKRALGEVDEGATLAVTGIWGDFVLPAKTEEPLLMVAAGIGVTPFVSQLRHLHAVGQSRDVVMIYVASTASELAFADEIEQTATPVVVFTRDEPSVLPAHWKWAGGARLDATTLHDAVPDLSARHAYISGPPRLIADLAPALAQARSTVTDAFSGY